MTTPRTGSFRPDIQGLRAIAVGFVLLYHAGVPFLPGGYVGVDVFFVISGFLISSHLLSAIERDGRIDFARFYARRARRILPASIVVAVLTAVSVVLFAPMLSAPGSLRDAVATVLYVPNIWFAIQDTDYLADHAASPFQHYWSLGVEEQFYLVWPVVLLLIALAVRRRRRRLAVAVAILSVVSFAGGVWLTQAQQPLAFFLLPTRAWELLAGALVAFALLGRSPRIASPVAAVGGWAGVALIVAGGVLLNDATPFPGWAAALPVVGTAAVIFFGHGSPSGGPTRTLALPPFQFVGLISYSLYLVHWPLLIIPQSAVGFENPLPLWLTLLLGVVLAVPLAWLLFRFVEEPMRNPPALATKRPRVTLWLTAAVTVVVAGSLALTTVWADGRTVGSGQDVPTAAAFPTAPPTATDALPANLRPTLGDAADDVPSVYPDGCHHDTVDVTVQECAYGDPDGSFRVALFGDSHAAQWLPALEQIPEDDTEIGIRAYSKSSCPAVDVTVLVKNVPYESCDVWRDAVTAALAADAPDLVVISSYAHYDLAAGSADWSSGVQRTVGTLTDAGSDVLVIADTPAWTAAPSLCISRVPNDLAACAGDRSTVLDEAHTSDERAAVERSGGRFVDFTDFICDPTTCPVVIDDLLVYRDINHLTATFVEYLAPALTEEIRQR